MIETYVRCFIWYYMNHTSRQHFTFIRQGYNSLSLAIREIIVKKELCNNHTIA